MAPLTCEECGALVSREVIPDDAGYVVGTICRECHTVTPESRPFEHFNHAVQALWQRQEAGAL